MIAGVHARRRVATWCAVIVLPTLAGSLALRHTREHQSQLTAVRDQRIQVRAELSEIQAQVTEASARLAHPAVPPAEISLRTGVNPPIPHAADAGDEAHRWLRPPATLPCWQPESPYVWIGKELFAKLPLKPLTRDGALEDPVADALSIPENLREVIRVRIGDVLSSQQEMESENVLVRTTAGAKGEPEVTRIEVEIPSMAPDQPESSLGIGGHVP